MEGEPNLSDIEARLRDQELRLRALEARVQQAEGGSSPRRSRRQLLRSVLIGGLGAAGALGLSRRDAAAANGDPLVLGSSTNAATSETKLTVAGGGTFPDNSALVVDATPIANAMVVRGRTTLVGSSSGGNTDALETIGGNEGTNQAGAGIVATGGIGAVASGGIGAIAQGGSNPNGQGGLGLGAAGGTGVSRGAPLALLPPSGQAGGVPAGPPPGGRHFVGEVWMDNDGSVYVCTAAGAPGTWAVLQPGASSDGSRDSFVRHVITTQPTLLSSDGTTWVDMTGGPILTLTAPYNCTAVLLANVDLWTDTAGYNQDLGISVGGGLYPTAGGQPEAWKESGGGSAYAPTAALLLTSIALVAGTAYTVKLQWKTNRSAPGVRIFAGAGPIAGEFSPTSLAAYLIALT